MKILGINAFGQNPAACLVIDGMLKAFSHEERFNRLKCSHNMFPIQTIKWLLSSEGLCLSDINVIAFNWDCQKYPGKMLAHMVGQRANVFFSGYTHPRNKNIKTHRNRLEHTRALTAKNIEQKIKDELSTLANGEFPKIEFCDHHLCHAYQSYYHSGYEDAIVLVADGHGEENTISGYRVKDRHFKKVLNYKIPYSLGWFYAGITAYLGFNPNRDEGKLMGLAAYGSRINNSFVDIFDNIINTQGKELKINPFYLKMGTCSISPYFSDHLKSLITSVDEELMPIKNPHNQEYLKKGYINLAFAAQSKLEEALVFIVKDLINKTGIKKLCVAGGLGLNCKANMEIQKQCNLDDIFIHPASSDDGSAIGAAFILSASFGKLTERPLKNAYFGISFGNDEIEKILKTCNIKYTKHNDICSKTANLLKEEKIVGWFQNSAEMGARALGARSIVANPQNQNTKTQINERVKYRENWRPYCPSILDEFSERYIENTNNMDYMIMATHAKNLLKNSAPATVHVDNTVRPQCVKKNNTPLWHHLIDEFNSIGGSPVILNTSFNVRGEPIVNSPYDAIRTFYSTGLDALAIGDFIVQK